MELGKKPQHYTDVKFRGILIFRIRFCLLSLCISFCCDWKFEIYIWDTWSFSNVYRLGFRSEMLLWRLFRTVLSIPHLDYRKSCLLSTLSPLLLSSNVCILVLNRFWEISQTVSNGGRRCLSQCWFVFSLGEWYNGIWDSCGPVINHWIEIQLIHAYKFCVKCLSATTKRQQTVRRIKLVKRECQQRKSVFVIVTHQMCKTFHEPLMELASHVSPEQNRGTINYYTHFLKLILPSLLLSQIQKSILWLVYFGYFDHLSAETRDKQNKKWVDQTKGDRGNVKRKEDYFEISWT